MIIINYISLKTQIVKKIKRFKINIFLLKSSKLFFSTYEFRIGFKKTKLLQIIHMFIKTLYILVMKV